MEYITFVNDTPFPVVVETWRNRGVYGLSELSGETVKEYQELRCMFGSDTTFHLTSRGTENPYKFAEGNREAINTLYSITGEWYIHSLFTEKEISKQWKKHKLPQTNIAKFRSSPCARGDYFWMNIENHFNMYYNETNKKLHFFLTPKVTREDERLTP